MAWQTQPTRMPSLWQPTGNSEYGAWFSARHRQPAKPMATRKLGVLPNNQAFDASALDITYRSNNKATLRPKTAFSYTKEHLPPLDMGTSDHDTGSLPGALKTDVHTRKPRSAPQGRQFLTYSGIQPLVESDWMTSLGVSKDVPHGQKSDKPNHEPFSINDMPTANSTDTASSSHIRRNGSPWTKLAPTTNLDSSSLKGSSPLNLPPDVNSKLPFEIQHNSECVEKKLSSFSISNVSLQNKTQRQILTLQKEASFGLAESYASYRKADPLNRYSVNLRLHSRNDRVGKLQRNAPESRIDLTDREEDKETIYTTENRDSIKTAFATIKPHSLTGVTSTISPSPLASPRTGVLNLSRKPAKSILRKTGLPTQSSINILSPESIPSYPFVYGKTRSFGQQQQLHNIPSVPIGFQLKPTKRVTFNI